MAQVTLKFTGNVHTRMGAFGLDFAFQGSKLRDLLNDVTACYNVRDLLLDDRGGIRPHARVLVNGRFSEVLQGLDTPVRDGDTVVLIHPYAVAF